MEFIRVEVQLHTNKVLNNYSDDTSGKETFGTANSSHMYLYSTLSNVWQIFVHLWVAKDDAEHEESNCKEKATAVNDGVDETSEQGIRSTTGSSLL